jgi:hypothetical protein
MQGDVDGTNLDCGKWELAVVGSAIDARGRKAMEFAQSVSPATRQLAYDPDSLWLTSGEEVIQCDDLADWLDGLQPRSLILEATTLGLPEILLSVHAAIRIGLHQLTLLYLEPLQYNAPREEIAIHRRDFDLSDEITGYTAIPGWGFILDETAPQQTVFCIGYEGHRLDQAFEQLSINPDHTSVVLGVPAFRPGWEMNTFANNIRVMRERKLRGGVEFCAADNPAAVYELLAERHRAAGARQQFFVAPIGTKPHGIGAALFACVFDDVGVLYDHPKRRADRTNDVGRWHLFTIEFDE